MKVILRIGMMVKLSGWVLLLLMSEHAFGNMNPVCEKFTTQNMLLSNEVYAVVSDLKGYVWMATSRGVVRFDGKNSMYFSTSNGLSDQVALKLFLSPEGTLWVFCADKTLHYLDKENRFVAYKYATSLKEVLNTNNYSEISAIHFKNEEPQFFATTLHGLLYVCNQQVCTYLSQQKGILLKSDIGLAGYRGDTTFDIHYNKKTYKGNSRIKHPNALVRRNKDLIFTIDNYLFIVRGNRVVSEAIFSDLILAAYEDKEQNIWISSYNKGVRRFENGEAINEQGGVLFFEKELITGVCQDFEGGYWFSTHSNGVMYVSQWRFFEAVKEDLNNIRAVTLDQKGRVYVVTDGKKIIRYAANGSGSEEQVLPGPQNSVCNDICFGAADNNLYVSFSHGIYTLDDRLRLSDRVIQGSKGILFASDRKHVYTISGHMVYKIRFSDNVVVNRAMTDETVETLFEDSWGNVWIGTHSGLSVFRNGNITGVFRSRIKDRISSIQQLPTGEWVVGTIGQGMYVIDRTGGIGHVRFGSDLRKNIINDIDIVKNELWVATGDGIVIVRYKDKQHYEWYQYEGAFKEIRKMMVHGEQMYFWAGHTIVKMEEHPRLMVQARPRLLLDSMLVNGKVHEPSAPAALRYDENNVKIYFHTIAFRFGKTITYRYRLSGLDTAWNQLNHAELEFESLPSGAYVLQVMSVSPGGIAASSPITVAFVIADPFWKNGVLIGLSILLLIGTAVVILSIIYKRKMRLNVQRERYIYMEQQALSAQINPHFIFNALNSIQNVLMTAPQLKALQYLGQFSVLMRLSLENARQKWVPPSEEMRLIKVYLELEKLRFKDKFTYTVSYEPTDAFKEILIPSMLIQPFVENAILHGVNHLENRSGKIDIRLLFDDGHLIGVVDDNGVGRKQAAHFESKHAKQNRSYGVQITCERLQILSAQMKGNYYYEVIDKVDSEQESEGTKVVFSIPFKEAK